MGDYTYARRQREMRQRRKESGFVEVRERVPPDLVLELKRIAAEMRDPEAAEAFLQRLGQVEKETSCFREAAPVNRTF